MKENILTWTNDFLFGVLIILAALGIGALLFETLGIIDKTTTKLQFLA